ncbi:MAG: arylsulfatase [Acidobacteria bacterium]|nr:arylsulfatase [Acidobacteriota bacterium]
MVALGAVLLCLANTTTIWAQEKPNIVVIWGDDIGYWNVSAYNLGMMGYRTPNIDRLAREGALFTDAYGEQSCTAARSAFITGQSPIRTGLSHVGLPGTDLGLKKEDPTIAEYLKTRGYMTGHYGKNHLGDRDEQLPTNHGFDEFFGNLYHLNAEEEPENPNYPKDPEFRKRFGPRGVIKSIADGKIEDTGPLTRKRMETIDDEVTAGALDFIERAQVVGKPFFLWWNSTRMHIWIHLKAESDGKTGLGVFPDGMVEHDGHVGQILDKLDELGLTENTIVIYSSDNGAEVSSWPEGGTTPFRGEKNDNWEGGYRVPLLVRWPGMIEPGTQINDIISHMDWFPTIAAVLGDDNIKEELKKGTNLGDRSFKVHLDGYNFLPYFKGETKEPPRKEFFYFSDAGDLLNLRYNNHKIVFAEQRARGYAVWEDPFVFLRWPKLFNLRSDPFEEADQIGIGYSAWRTKHMFLLVPARVFVEQFFATFKEFPPRQTPGSFTIDPVKEKLKSPVN